MLKAKILLVICSVLLVAAVSVQTNFLIQKSLRGRGSAGVRQEEEVYVKLKSEKGSFKKAEPLAKGQVVKKIPLIAHKKSASVSPRLPARLKTPKKQKAAPAVTVSYEISTRYDSNTYQYSGNAIDMYKSYQERDTRFKHVSSISDIITGIFVDASKQFRWFKRLPTRIGAWVKSDIYAYNPINNQQEYAFYIRQQLNKAASFELGYVYTPMHFLKYLLDVDIPSGEYDRFAKAYYRENEIDAILRYRPAKDWYTRLRYRLELDDYNGSFKERSCTDNSVRMDLIKSWRGAKVSTGVFYDYTYSSARGKDDDPELDVDNSYVQDKLGCLFRLPFYKETRIEAEYSCAYRRFTSRLPISDDPLHRDRFDRIQNAKIAFVTPFIKDSDWFIGYEYEYRDPHLKASDEDTSSEPLVGYTQNIVVLGIKGTF